MIYRFYFPAEQVYGRFGEIEDWLKENIAPDNSGLDEMIVNVLKQTGLRLWDVELPIVRDDHCYLYRFSRYEDMLFFKMRWHDDFRT
jgi:hypothetical protein